jgi:V8-like Glu-specific endopeptidase
MPSIPSSRRSVPSLLPLFAVLPFAGGLAAQVGPWPEHIENVLVASGPIANPLPIEVVAWQGFVTLPANIPWLRLQYAKATLDVGSHLRIVSLRDGEVMTQHHEHVQQWGGTSAYFNGNSVLVELVAGPGTVGNEIQITSVLAGDADWSDPETICGTTDDRVPSTDARAGRLANGCSGWLIDRPTGAANDRLHLSAGHCFSSNTVQQFAVPASTAGCSLVQPPVAKQFAVDSASSTYVNGGVGNDYWVYRCFPNSTTGRTSFQEQGTAFTLATAMPAVSATIRNTGYGLDGTNTNAATGNSCSCSSGNGTGTRNQTQQTHTGALLANAGTTLRHRCDTCGGNSGSVLIDEASGAAVGIHTHGGCNSTSSTSSNSGTQVTHPGLQAAIAAVCSACARHSAYGTSCSSARSFYEQFAANGSDLGGRTVVATRNAFGGYDVGSGPIGTFQAPTGAGLALGDDVASANLALPFTFDFPGGSTATIRVDSNGRIHLAGAGATDISATVGELLGSATPLIAAAWCDLHPDGAANTRNVFVHSPVAGTYCITWNDVVFFGQTGAVTVQVALIDNGTADRFELRYQALSTPNLANMVAFSPGNGAVDPGARDLSGAPFATAADSPLLTLGASPAPVLGSTVTFTVSNVRPSASITQVLASFASTAPTPLATIGLDAPGCMLNIPVGSSSFGPLLLTNPTASVVWPVPSSPVWIGVSIYLQAFELVPAANPAGVISSNGLQTRIHSL